MLDVVTPTASEWSEPSSLTRDERALIVAATLARARFGSAGVELTFRRARLGRLEGYAVLASLDRRGLVVVDADGIAPTFAGLMFAGLDNGR